MRHTLFLYGATSYENVSKHSILAHFKREAASKSRLAAMLPSP